MTSINFTGQPAYFSTATQAPQEAGFILRKYWKNNASIAFLATLCMAYIFAGLIGHDPWKQDEAYIFSGVFHIIKSGDWVVPYVAGEPFMEKPPLYHIVASLLAKLASPILPLHDGARLASGLFFLISVLSLGWSARHSWGKGYGRKAILLLLASLGLIVHVHMMLTDVALFSGFSIAIAGLVACANRFRQGGMLLGLGAGVGFMSKGLIAIGVLGISAWLLPILFLQWRREDYLKQMAIAFLIALPWITVWPVALYLRSPELFHVWFWDNNIGRFFGFSIAQLGAANEPGFWWKTLPWFLFPTWIFALLAIKSQKDALQHPAIQIGMTLAATFTTVLAVSSSARAIYAMPIILALTLVGAGAVGNLPDWGDRIMTLSGSAIALLAIALLWPVWLYMVFYGQAPHWPWLIRVLPENFKMPVSFPLLGMAIFLTVGFFILISQDLRKGERGLHTWVGSLLLFWGLAMTLWLPWIDEAKSYRSMYQTMKIALPQNTTCMASVHLGESERAMLNYVLGIDTLRKETNPSSACDLLLTQRNDEDMPIRPPSNYRLAWTGARTGDVREHFNLYLKDPPAYANATRTETLALNGAHASQRKHVKYHRPNADKTIDMRLGS